jgi:penicillin V acylase-like amidase (Ntn superfamily)
MRAIQKILITLGFCVLLAPHTTQACSRLIWYTDDYGLFVTRTMDWVGSTQPTIEVRAAGQAYVGTDHGVNIVSWTSKYATMMNRQFATKELHDGGVAGSILKRIMGMNISTVHLRMLNLNTL